MPPPEKTQGWISLSFMCNCFVFELILYKCIRGQYKGHLGGLDKVFKIRDRHHRIHRQKLRQNEGLIVKSREKSCVLQLSPARAL